MLFYNAEVDISEMNGEFIYTIDVQVDNTYNLLECIKYVGISVAYRKKRE